MEGKSKLLAAIDGVPLVRRAAETLLEGGIKSLRVVVGPRNGPLREALAGLDATFTVNPDPKSGMASSIVAGVSAMPEDTDGLLLMLGDMPALKPSTVAELLEIYRGTDKTIVVPTFNGRRGHPAILSLVHHRAELLALTGDEGARRVLAANGGTLLEAPVSDPGILLDIDTRDELEDYLTGREEKQ